MIGVVIRHDILRFILARWRYIGQIILLYRVLFYYVFDKWILGN